jgi:hypothetical protein
VHVRRKVLLDEIRQKSHEVVAASLVAHVRYQSQVPGFPVRNPTSTLTQNPGNPKGRQAERTDPLVYIGCGRARRSERRERSEPAKRLAIERVGDAEGQSPSERIRNRSRSTP